MIPIGRADGHGASVTMHCNSTLLKRTSVGVKKARVPETIRDIDRPEPTVMATNSNPIRVAAASPARVKKLSQAWSMSINRLLKKSRRWR
jgi:hypothetical protein